MSTHICVCKYTHIHIYTPMCVCKYTYVCIYMYSNIQTYKHEYVHTYTHPVSNTVKDSQFRLYQWLQGFAGIAEGLLKLYLNTFTSVFTNVLQNSFGIPQNNGS